RVRGDVVCQQLYALFRTEVDHLDPVLPKPVNAALKVDRLADDHCADPELPNQPAAVPARRKRGDHDLVAVAALSAGFAKGVGLAVNRRIIFLNSAVVSASKQIALLIKQRSANRNPTFGESKARLFKSNIEQCLIIDSHSISVRGL